MDALHSTTQEARDGNIDADLLDVFVTYRIWKLTENWKKRV